MKTVTLIILFLFYLNVSSGQSVIGLAAGPNYSVIPYTTYYDVADADSKFSYTVGSSFTAPLYKHFSYSVGINFNRLDSHITAHESSASHHTIEDIDLSLGFVALNVMPQFSFGNKKSFYIKAGGYFSVLAKSKESGTYETFVVNGDHHQGKINRDARNDYEDFDYGLAFNTGVRLKFDEVSWFVVQTGYNLGLYKYNQVGSNIRNVKNSGFKSAYFLLGFDFKLGPK
ncbi:MAG TPA: outer membrane beta-barrel protein [Bacteroidales bacterium]|nr:outer membrane beta-barrel protein [Bacteroidales bacterium]